MTLTDQSTQVRPGEELDAAVIDPYFKANIPGLHGLPSISQFPGGAPTSPTWSATRAATSCCAAPPSVKRPSRPTTWAASSASSTS